MNATPDAALTRDILQTQLLANICARDVREAVVLKGGVAMRVHGSTRRTKDIDLAQAPSASLRNLQDTIRQSIRDILGMGLLTDCEVSEPKQTNTVARWKINGTSRQGSHVQLTIEVSRRGLPHGHVTTVNYVPPAETGVAPLQVRCYDRSAMAAAKVAALLDARRVAPRDLYDLAVLIDMKVEPPVEMLAGLGAEELSQAVESLWSKIDLMDWPLFRQEVVEYLPDTVSSGLDETAYEAMRLLVGEHVERWLQAASDVAQARSAAGMPAPGPG